MSPPGRASVKLKDDLAAVDKPVVFLAMRMARIHLTLAAEQVLIPITAGWNVPHGNERLRSYARPSQFCHSGSRF